MQLTYTVRFAVPCTHYIQVEMQIADCSASELNLKMPVWIPGSYLVREFARHIDFVEVQTTDGSFQRVKKFNKNTWTIKTEGQNTVTVRYRVYCFEWSVRTNFVDDDHAFLNGAPTFLYVEGFEKTPAEIHIQPPPIWTHISTPLLSKNGDPWIRVAQSADELIDSPIEIGNHASHFFETNGVQHEVALYGESNCAIPKLLEDLKAITIEETKIFGSHPCKNYLFIIHHSETSFGGLEHMLASVNHITRWGYKEKKYKQAISLLAHEYFHLWNIKRIRPAELTVYNYDEETYTELLWFFEGVTSYYDDLVCYRAGVFPQEQYLDIVAENLNRVLNTPGVQVQTLAEASFDTWLKYYRQNENSNNSQISYYIKGGVVAMLFDFMIMDATDGERSLDNVMRALYENYLAEPGKGVTELSLLETFQAVSGIDFQPYFQKFIHTTEDIQPDIYFELLGLKLNDKSDPKQFYLGMSTQRKENKVFITKLERGFGAYLSGLNVNDEIISIDGCEVMEEFEKIYAGKQPGDVLQLIISRQGIMKEIAVTLTPDTRKNYKIKQMINPSIKQQRLLKKWLPFSVSNADQAAII